MSQKAEVQVPRSDTPFAGHEEPRDLATQSSQRTSWKEPLPCLLLSAILAYLGCCVHACARTCACVLPATLYGIRMDPWSAPPRLPLPSKSHWHTRVSSLFPETETLVHNKHPSEVLDQQLKVFEGHRTVAQRSELQTLLLRAG